MSSPRSTPRLRLTAALLMALVGLVAVSDRSLATRSLAISVVLLAAFHLVYASAARAEDAFLAQAHGAGFEAFLDAASLVGLYVLLRLADFLQAAGITPTWLALP